MISAKEHKKIIDSIYEKTGFYPYGYMPGCKIPDVQDINYCFGKNCHMKIGCWINYTDTTGIRDYTGIVFSLMINYRHFRTYTSLDQFLADSDNIPLWEKQAAEQQYLAAIKKDFM